MVTERKKERKTKVNITPPPPPIAECLLYFKLSIGIYACDMKEETFPSEAAAAKVSRINFMGEINSRMSLRNCWEGSAFNFHKFLTCCSVLLSTETVLEFTGMYDERVANREAAAERASLIIISVKLCYRDSQTYSHFWTSEKVLSIFNFFGHAQHAHKRGHEFESLPQRHLSSGQSLSLTSTFIWWIIGDFLYTL